MKTKTFALLLLAGTSLAASLPARAEPIYPGASAVGLEPPPGMEPAKGFQGFKQGLASIAITELPKPAYAQIEPERDAFAQRFKAKAADSVEIGGAKGFLVKGSQQTNDGNFRKWIVVLDGAEETALITAQVPEADSKVSDEAIDKALHTIVFRAKPTLEQQVAMLPFTIGDLAGFRESSSMMGATLLLTDGPNDQDPAHSQAHVVVSDDSGHPPPPGDKVALAKAQLQSFQAVRTEAVEDAKPFEADGASWVQVEAKGSEGPQEVPVAITYFVRYGTNDTLSIVCVAPQADKAKFADRFRKLALSIKPKS